MGSLLVDSVSPLRFFRYLTPLIPVVMLFRVGDALASRDIHAAIYDSLRLCKEF